MNKQDNVTGVILAGGLGRRMNNLDKGLADFKGKDLVSYAIAAMQPLVGRLLLNANRNIEEYQKFGLPVISDQTNGFDGPLAGILAAMSSTDSELLLVMPCDCPLLTTAHLQKLVSACIGQDADIAVASDGERLHPVILALKTSLRASLQEYLANGGRKVESWLNQHQLVTVDFSVYHGILINLNTLDELSELASKTGWPHI